MTQEWTLVKRKLHRKLLTNTEHLDESYISSQISRKSDSLNGEIWWDDEYSDNCSNFHNLNGTLFEKCCKQRICHFKNEMKQKHHKRLVRFVSQKLHCPYEEIQYYSSKTLKRMPKYEKFEYPMKKNQEWQKLEIRQSLQDYLL
jgi:hypothetical protein